MALGLTRGLLSGALLLVAFVAAPAGGTHKVTPGRTPIRLHRGASGGRADAATLFQSEIGEATSRLRWHGEPLGPDCLYALAVTGASWEPAWGKQRLFSLAWGDCRKMGGKRGEEYNVVVSRLRRAFDEHQYPRVLEIASSDFALEEIGCDVNVKEPVGQSFLALGQPERAFPIFAAPFDPARALLDVAEANRRFREAAFEAAQRAGLRKEAIAFGCSLLLDPGSEAAPVNNRLLDYLQGAGVDINRLLLGVLECPEKLRGLPVYTYAAADLLALRANPRLLPFLLHLVQSDDVYLRSRALVGLGIIAYQPRRNDPPDWARRVVMVPLVEYGISASQREMIAREIREAATNDHYRLRAAAALALALVGEEDCIPLLQKLSRDKTYITLSDGAKGRSEQTLQFPVRMAAAAALARYGVRAETGGGTFAGRSLETARRGNQDATNDRRNLRRDVASRFLVSPIDVATGSLSEEKVKR